MSALFDFSSNAKRLVKVRTCISSCSVALSLGTVAFQLRQDFGFSKLLNQHDLFSLLFLKLIFLILAN
jgi:hypothetical protein